MSKLSELINQYCPNGVEYKTLETVCEYIRGVTYQKNKSQFQKSGFKKSCHPEFISGSHPAILYEMPKQVRHDLYQTFKTGSTSRQFCRR